MNLIFLDLKVILDLNKSITALATKAELKAQQDKIVKLQAWLFS